MSIVDLTLVIPFLVCIILLLFFRKQVVWWEYLLVVVPSIIIVLVLRTAMISYNTTSKEYLGNYVAYVQHYDHWDEWISQTCTSTCCCDSKGNNCQTTTYDCSYRKDHPEYWVKVTENGDEIEIDEDEYIKLSRQFHSPSVFVPMHRDYYQINGDAQRYEYQGDVAAVETVITPHNYTNKVKASHSIYKFEDIDKKEALRWKLNNYPEIVNYHQPTVINYNVKIPDSTQKRFDYINGVYGPKHQVHLFILFYQNQPYDVVRKQLDYWKGGNKNELLIHIGVDNTGKIQWYDATSWMDKPECTVRIKDYLSTQTTVDLNKFAIFLMPTIEQYWHRKHFRDFNYLHVELSNTQLTWVLVILILYNIGISIWVIANNYTVDDPDGSSRYNRSW